MLFENKKSEEQEASKFVIFHCEVHGEKTREIFYLNGGWSPVYCGECEEKKYNEREEREARRLEAEGVKKRRDLIDRLFRGSAIPARFRNNTFETYDPSTEKAKNIKARCEEYALNFPENLKVGRSILMIGNTGTGKTHLANSICNFIIQKHQKTAVFSSIIEAVRRVKETYSKDSSEAERQAIKAFIEPDLLVLDEVGIQVGSDTERTILFELLNGRYNEMKPTILLSNLDIEKIKPAIGDRVLDRMKENGGMTFIFDWSSHRGKNFATTN